MKKVSMYLFYDSKSTNYLAKPASLGHFTSLIRHLPEVPLIFHNRKCVDWLTLNLVKIYHIQCVISPNKLLNFVKFVILQDKFLNLVECVICPNKWIDQ